MPCITLVIALFLFPLLFQVQRRQRLCVYSKYLDIAILLDPLRSTVPLLLSARAQPNKLLARTSKLSNSFASVESRIREQYIARARKILRKKNTCPTLRGIERISIFRTAYRCRSGKPPSITISSSSKRDPVCHICAGRHYAACRLFLSRMPYTPRYRRGRHICCPYSQ
jgi:hypothetical protein